MIVCVCHGVSCSRIRSIVRDGAESVDAVGDACGAGTDCGSCRETIEDIIDEVAPASARTRRHLPMQMAG